MINSEDRNFTGMFFTIRMMRLKLNAKTSELNLSLLQEWLNRPILT
jgi:hypothetical protein